MIGTILSMRYFGKKSWLNSIVFWVVYFIIAAVAAYALSAISVEGGIIGFVIAIIVWFVLAHYWKTYNFAWPVVLKLFIIAFIIDVIIIFVLIQIWTMVGYTFPEWFPSLSQCFM